MLERVKLALRISHTLLDTEIETAISSARAEMVRAGISQDKADSTDDELINLAIITWCKMLFANDQKLIDGYSESWKLQLDQMRKTEDYQ